MDYSVFAVLHFFVTINSIHIVIWIKISKVWQKVSFHQVVESEASSLIEIHLGWEIKPIRIISLN